MFPWYLQFSFSLFSFICISWRLITLQYCSGFCHTLIWIIHGFTCVPHPEPPPTFIIFPILLFSSISLHWSLRNSFLFLLGFLWDSAFKWVYLSFSPLSLASLFSAICKASSDSHFASLHFFFLGIVLIPVSYKVSWTSIHSSSGPLSIRSIPLNLFLTSTV